MYLTALITKWRNKGIRFILECPDLNKFEITAAVLSKGRYISIVTEDLEQGCKYIDAGLMRNLEVGSDNNHANAGKE